MARSTRLGVVEKRRAAGDRQIFFADGRALLGAAGLGDIGKLFPDSDERYRGISSLLLLKEVGKRLRENGWQVVNLDSTIVAQAPKLAPYREAMRRNLAEALGIDVSQVSVKATTEERLGFTGDGSGMAAQAIALLEKVEGTPCDGRKESA